MHLDGPRMEPAGAPTALVAVLHGYGANGDDLIALGDGWRRQLPQAVFVAPDAPEEIPGMPGARQWFPLTFRDPGERWRGVGAARPGLDRFLDAELAREKITLRQWEVLASIVIHGELSQAELAERLGIEAPTLAGILSRMERDGWLERTSCPEDRRKKRLRVTSQAEAVWSRMVECCRRVRQQATEGLSTDELNQLRDTCERIRANLGAAEPLLETTASR